MSVRRLLRRYGFHATVTVGASLLAAGSWLVYDLATRDSLADAETAIEAGHAAEARGLLERYLSDESPADEPRARLLLARAMFVENDERGTLTRETLSDIEAELQRIEGGKAEAHFELAWKVVEGYGALGEPRRQLAALEWLGKSYSTRAEIDLARARALVDLGPVHEFVGKDGGAETDGERKFEEALRCFSAKSDDPDREREVAFLRALAHQRAADHGRQGIAARERQARFEDFREAIEWVLDQEARLAAVLEGWVASVPADRADRPPAQRARLEVAACRIRRSEILADLAWKQSSRFGEDSPEAAGWRTASEADLTSAQAALEGVVGATFTEAADLTRARFLLADLYRRRGEFERSAELYEQLSKSRPDDEIAIEGWLLALLGRTRIAIDLASRPGAADGAGWADAEGLLATFEAKVGTQAAILAEGGSVFEALRDRRLEAEERDLGDFLRRNDARPELGRVRRAEVEERVAEFRLRYSRHAADLYAGAARLTRDAAVRLDCDWKAAENYRVVGAWSAEVLALQDFIDRSAGATVGRWGSLFEKTPTAALEYLGLALERLGHVVEAERIHQANVDVYPATPPAYRSRLALGRLAERRGDLEEALRRYASIRSDAQMQFDPQSPIWRLAIYRLAAVYEHLAIGGVAGALEKAEDLYREAIRRYPEDPRLAEAWFRLGRIESRLARLRAAEDRDEEAAKRFRGAVADLRRAVATAEKDLAGRMDAASADLSPLEADGDAPVRPEAMTRQARYTLADALYEQALAAPEAERPALLEEAFAAYEDAVRQHPRGLDEAWGFYQEGQIHRLLGRSDRARRALERVESALEKAMSDGGPGEEGGRGRPEGIDPAYWASILDWEARFRKERGDG